MDDYYIRQGDVRMSQSTIVFTKIRILKLFSVGCRYYGASSIVGF